MRLRSVALVCLLVLGVPALAGSLLPNGEQQFSDQNGQPYGAGTVGFYIPNTLTPKTTWRDASQVTPNANPVVLDSAGRAIIYGSGTYRQILKDVFGNVIWDQLTNGSGSGSQNVNGTIAGSTTIAVCDGTFPVRNTSGGPITINLPTSPNTGDTCAFEDLGNNAGTFPITISMNPKTTPQAATTWVMRYSGQAIAFTWVGSENFWVPN